MNDFLKNRLSKQTILGIVNPKEKLLYECRFSSEAVHAGRSGGKPHFPLIGNMRFWSLWGQIPFSADGKYVFLIYMGWTPFSANGGDTYNASFIIMWGCVLKARLNSVAIRTSVYIFIRLNSRSIRPISRKSTQLKVYPSEDILPIWRSQPIWRKSTHLKKYTHLKKVYPSQESLPIWKRSTHLKKACPSEESLLVSRKSTHLKKVW